MKYELGKLRVRYACPSCNAGLSNPLADIGQGDQCPDCGLVYEVPGREEYARRKLAAQQQKQAAQQQKQQKQDERQAAKMRAQQDRIKARQDAEAVKNIHQSAPAAETPNYYAAPVTRPARVTSPSSRKKYGDAKPRGGDFFRFFFPPLMVSESDGHAYHNKRFPALSLVTRLFVQGATILFVFACVFLFGTYGVAVYFVASDPQLLPSMRLARVIGYTFAAGIGYFIICWITILRLAASDWLRSFCAIEENTRNG